MTTIITVLILLVCLLLSVVILIQNPKGGGLASGISGVNQLGGVQKTTDFLEKATWSLVVALMVLSLMSAAFDNTTTLILDDEAPIEQTSTEDTAPGQ